MVSALKCNNYGNSSVSAVMGINILSQIPCNTIGFSTNKEKKPDVLKIDSKRIALRYDDIGIVVLKPIIDRLIFGFFITQDFINQYDPTITVEEYKAYIKGSLFQEAKYVEGIPSKPIDGVSFVKNVSFKKGRLLITRSISGTARRAGRSRS